MKIKLEPGAFEPVRAHPTDGSGFSKEHKPAHNFRDLSGKQVGHLLVLKRVEDKCLASGIRKAQYLCLCDCGKTKKIIGESLARGTTKSCGCHRGDPLIRYSTKHGHRYERIYSIYCDMKKRCYNQKCIGYKNYGGKGITICDEWLNDFESFYNWSMENGYSDNLTIDRINSAGNYEPANCRWITRSENITRRNIEYWRRYHENQARTGSL